jgi:hypothetical protein
MATKDSLQIFIAVWLVQWKVAHQKLPSFCHFALFFAPFLQLPLAWKESKGVQWHLDYLFAL